MKRAAFFELTAHISKLVINLDAYQKINSAIAKKKNEGEAGAEDLKVLLTKRSKICSTILLASCDTFVASNTLGLPQSFGIKFNDGIVGLVGSFSACVGIY